MKTPLYYLTLSIHILSMPPTPPPHFPVTPNLTPTPLVFLLSCFYFCCPVCCLFAILLNDNMDLHILSLSTLVSEGPWCVFYATRCQVYGGLTHNVFYWYSNLISPTHKHTQHTQGPVDWRTPIVYIYTTCYVLTATTFIKLNEWFNE